MAAYLPASSYPGKVTFVWAETEGASYRVWKRTPEAHHGETFTLHSGHMDWVSKRLDILAALLRTALANVQQPVEDTL